MFYIDFLDFPFYLDSPLLEKRQSSLHDKKENENQILEKINLEKKHLIRSIKSIPRISRTYLLRKYKDSSNYFRKANFILNLDQELIAYERSIIKRENIRSLNKTKVFIISKEIEMNEEKFFSPIPINNYNELSRDRPNKLKLHRDVGLRAIRTTDMHTSDERDSGNHTFLLRNLLTLRPEDKTSLKFPIKKLKGKKLYNSSPVRKLNKPKKRLKKKTGLVKLQNKNKDKKKKKKKGLGEFEYKEWQLTTFYKNPKKYFSLYKNSINEAYNKNFIPVFFYPKLPQNFLTLALEELLGPYLKKKSFGNSSELKNLFLGPFFHKDKDQYNLNGFVPEQNEELLDIITNSKILTMGLGDFLNTYITELIQFSPLNKFKTEKLLFIPSKKEFNQQTRFAKSTKLKLTKKITSNPFYNYQGLLYKASQQKHSKKKFLSLLTVDRKKLIANPNKEDLETLIDNLKLLELLKKYNSH